MSVEMGPDDNDVEFQTPNNDASSEPIKPRHFLLEGTPGPKIDDHEKLQPGEVMTSVQNGDRFYVIGLLVRDESGQMGQLVSVELVKDDEKYEDDDPSIHRPKKMTNPKLTVRFADETVKTFGPNTRLPEPVYRGRSLNAGEEFKLSAILLRDHIYHLGDLVSFGNGVGKLAMIIPGEGEKETYVGIIAEAERGKGGPRFVWKVKASEMDYIEHDEKGAIKRNPDNTIFKPNLPAKE